MNVNEEFQELGSKCEVTEPPPPIPPKRTGMICSGKIFSSTKPKGIRPPPPLPAVEALPSLPPKTKLALIIAKSLMQNVIIYASWFIGLYRAEVPDVPTRPPKP